MLIPPTLARLSVAPVARPLPVPPAINPYTSASITRCPECEAPITRASGCLSCLVCGWGKCG